MKVVIIPHGFQEHYTIGFANGITRQGVKVDLISANNLDPHLLHPQITWKNLRQNLDSNRQPLRKLIDFSLYHLRLLWYVIANQRAIIHVIGLLRYEIVTGIIEGFLFRLVGKKYILTVHNLLPHDQHTRTKRKLYKLVYKIPHYLVVHTERMKKELKELFDVPPSKVVVMQHGLNDIVPDHGWKHDECRAVLNVPQDKCVLLFFGRLAPYKGLELLLDAFKELGEQFFLVIAGKPDETFYGRKIEALIASHPHRERILCQMNFIENKDIATYFRAADTLIMPYRYIDQSGVMFLAFRFGLPIVAFNVGAVKEYLKNTAGVVIDGDHIEDLVSGIIFFYENQEHFSPILIREYAKKYRWTNLLAPVVELYSA